MAHGSSSSGNPYNNSYGNIYANDNDPGRTRPAANDNVGARPSASPASVATTKIGASPAPSFRPANANAGADFMASRANENFARSGITGVPLEGGGMAANVGLGGVAVPAPVRRVASSKLRGSTLHVSVAPSVAVTKIGSPARSPSVRSPSVTAPRAAAAIVAPRAAATPNAPSYKGYDAASGERSKAAESLVRCKPRPTDNSPKGGCGGGPRRFVPWC